MTTDTMFAILLLLGGIITGILLWQIYDEWRKHEAMRQVATLMRKMKEKPPEKPPNAGEDELRLMLRDDANRAAKIIREAMRTEGIECGSAQIFAAAFPAEFRAAYLAEVKAEQIQQMSGSLEETKLDASKLNPARREDDFVNTHGKK